MTSEQSTNAVRVYLRRELEAHLTQLGYSRVRARNAAGSPMPEIVRVSPIRGRIAYGEIVLHGDLCQPSCHERLLHFSQRRTRQRSTILFFIGVAEAELQEIETLLRQLDIRSSVRGGHVHVVPLAVPEETRRRMAARG